MEPETSERVHPSFSLTFSCRRFYPAVIIVASIIGSIVFIGLIVRCVQGGNTTTTTPNEPVHFGTIGGLD